MTTGSAAAAEFERLTVGDLATWWAEEGSSPMQIGLAGILDAPHWLTIDGRLRMDWLLQELDVRTRRVPSLRRRIHWTSVGQGRPVWVDDIDFDISRHVVCDSSSAGVTDGTFWEWAANH